MTGLSISGIWVGEFAYPGGLGPTTPFTAQIEDLDGFVRVDFRFEIKWMNRSHVHSLLSEE